MFWARACLNKLGAIGCTCPIQTCNCIALAQIACFLAFAPAIFNARPSQFALSHSGLYRQIRDCHQPPTIPIFALLAHRVVLGAFSATFLCDASYWRPQTLYPVSPVPKFDMSLCFPYLATKILSEMENAMVTLGSTPGPSFLLRLPKTQSCLPNGRDIRR